MMHGQRGQTLPITLGGVIAILAFAFFGLNYANTLRWQVRAQNAADSAAQAILALQTQQFNEMNATLYAAAVEEYRIRHILNAMVISANEGGGCDHSSSAALTRAPRGCYAIYYALLGDYQAAVGRYSGDVLLLHQATASMNFTNFQSDALGLLAKINQCNNALGGDCAFKYGKPIIEERQDTEAVFMDANGVIKPSPGRQTPLASSVSAPSSPPLNNSLFAPARVEVYACATVPSVIPSIFGLTFGPFTAVARGAATPVMVEEDWLQPGTINNPFTAQPYQPPEHFLATGTTIKDTTGYDWYDLDYAGNSVVAVNSTSLNFTPTRDDFSVFIGWWNSIPIHPFGGTKSPQAMGC